MGSSLVLRIAWLCFSGAFWGAFPLTLQAGEMPSAKELAGNPRLGKTWSARLMAVNREERVEAARAMVRGGADALPLLEFLLAGSGEGLQSQAFGILRDLGPCAVPLLVKLLEWDDDSVRLRTVSILIDLAPDSEGARPAMIRALRDREPLVARDAARALGALGAKAAPAVPDLVRALTDHDEHLRIYAAEALASVGPDAAAATPGLIAALRDPVPGVRWAACEALAAVGQGAASAVPRLIEALKDETLLVRICAAGALGAMGPTGSKAVDPLLRAAARDPAMRDEVAWALERITGTDLRDPQHAPDGAVVPPAADAHDPPPQGNPPVIWDLATGHNIVWSALLGDETFGRPVIADGTIYVGTDNAREMNPACQEECGVLMAFEARHGGFLWQDAAPRVERGMREFLLPATTSAPYIEGDRLYYVTAECQVRCLDARGFRDGENDGPFQTEAHRDKRWADLVWELDMCGKLGVFPHEASSSEIAVAGDLLLVGTSNGRNEGHTRVPSPRAPSLIALNKHTGEVVWRAVGAGERVLHGQWCSPVLVGVKGRQQVLYGGGDGWLRAYDAASGREVWRFDGNPKDAQWRPRPGVLSRNSIVAPPLYQDGRVFLAMGEDPSHGDGPSLLHAISPNGQGDVTASRCLWTCRELGRIVGTPVVSEGLLYTGDLGGIVSCIDAATGAVVWKHGTGSPIWGCLLLVRDRLYVGNEDGLMTILKTGRRKQEIGRIAMNAALHTRPALFGDNLVIATGKRLYQIGRKP